MEALMNNGMCRCCASEGTFKDVKSLYYWMGEAEIYAEMLSECFDVNLSNLDSSEYGGICEVCITQLRNASNFKKQVLQTEEQFKKYMDSPDKFFKAKVIKEEVTKDETELEDIVATAIDSDNASDDYPLAELDIKQEYKDEIASKSKKRTTRASASKSKKSRGDDGESSTKRVSARLRFNLRTEAQAKPEKDNSSLSSFLQRSSARAKSDDDKRIMNILEISASTNATPIRRHEDRGYMCCYCDARYPKPKDLKQHTIDNHKHVIGFCYGKRNDISSNQTKWDITGLACNICHAPLNDVNEALNHLKDIHQRSVDLDVINYMIPFKFDNDEIVCHICLKSFLYYRLLVQHMRDHLQNYTCEACGKGFITANQIRSHVRIHEKGHFPCHICGKVSDTRIKLKTHELFAHTDYKPHRCDRCSESFKTYRDKEVHLITAHKLQPKEFKCSTCNLKFSRQCYLRNHVQNQHLRLRNHKCPLCGKGFYKTSSLSDHLAKHSTVNQFKCSSCAKCYKHRKSLKAHMRSHVIGFTCDYCHEVYTAKSTLKNHIRTTHTECFDKNFT